MMYIEYTTDEAVCTTNAVTHVLTLSTRSPTMGITLLTSESPALSLLAGRHTPSTITATVDITRSTFNTTYATTYTTHTRAVLVSKTDMRVRARRAKSPIYTRPRTPIQTQPRMHICA